jgi:hypothetical protein
MTKKPTQFVTAAISVADLATLRHRCAWKGCAESFSIGPDPNPLPKGWRWLAVWRGPIALPPWSGVQDRDAVLCPKHFEALQGVLEDIGQRLDETEGSA